MKNLAKFGVIAVAAAVIGVSAATAFAQTPNYMGYGMMGRYWDHYSENAGVTSTNATSSGSGGWSTPSDNYQYPNMMGYYGYGPMSWGGGWGEFLMPFFGIAFAICIALLIVWAVRSTRRNSYGGSRAMDILEERYAKGEIDTKEFEEKKKAIGK